MTAQCIETFKHSPQISLPCATNQNLRSLPVLPSHPSFYKIRSLSHSLIEVKISIRKSFNITAIVRFLVLNLIHGFRFLSFYPPFDTLFFKPLCFVLRYCAFTSNPLPVKDPIQQYPSPSQIHLHPLSHAFPRSPPAPPSLSPAFSRQRLYPLLHCGFQPSPTHLSLHGYGFRPCLVPLFPLRMHSLRR